jgi:hypothetical protein
LNERHPYSVVFVCGEDFEYGSRVPIGTAFVVSVPGAITNTSCRFVVTARHVVEGRSELWLRLRKANGGTREVPLAEWQFHPTSDVAVAPCDVDTADLDLSAIEEEVFSDRWHERVPEAPLRIGEEAYFVGLLMEAKTMADRSVPMVRSGRLGAYYVRDIPLRDGPRTWVEPVVHLLDSYSRSGFSRAPCFADHPVIQSGDVEAELEPGAGGARRWAMQASITSKVALVGVVIGHFNSDGDNAGVAIVAPIEAVREVLDSEPMMAWRASQATPRVDSEP